MVWCSGEVQSQHLQHACSTSPHHMAQHDHDSLHWFSPVRHVTRPWGSDALSKWCLQLLRAAAYSTYVHQAMLVPCMHLACALGNGAQDTRRTIPSAGATGASPPSYNTSMPHSSAA
jgi:hypothetical protein